MIDIDDIDTPLDKACCFYMRAYDFLTDHGYGDEIRWAETLKPLEEQTEETFFQEYVWVVLNAGMKEQAARGVYQRFMEARDLSTIRHAGKREAVERALEHGSEWYSALLSAEDKIVYLETLPWVGPITKYHLARNLGIECVKPDRHLVRLAKRFGYLSPDALCRAIQSEFTWNRIGTIDLVLWRYCNLVGSEP